MDTAREQVRLGSLWTRISRGLDSAVPTTTLERAFRVGGIGVGGKFSGSKELENLPTISDTTYIFPAIGLSVMAVLIYKNNGLIGVTL